MRRRLWWRLAFLLGACLGLAGAAVAAPLPGQKGLPTELVIQDTPALDEQAASLLGLLQWAQENRPKGGLAGGLKGMFSRERPPAAVNLEALVESPGNFVGRFVSVNGIYEPLGPGKGQFRSSATTFVRITIPESVPVNGFPKGSPAGMPTEIQGVVASEAGVPLVQAMKVQPSLGLAAIRLARVQELQAEWLDTLSQRIAQQAELATQDVEVGFRELSGKYVLRIRALATRNSEKVRAAAGQQLGMTPNDVEIEDLEASRERLSGISSSTDVYARAAQTYLQVGGRVATGPLYTYVPFAGTHGALLEINKLADRGGPKRAAKQLSSLWTPLTAKKKNGDPLYYTWMPHGDGSWDKLPVREAIADPLDKVNRTNPWYSVVNWFVVASLGNPALGMILLALVSRIAIYPLTKKQLHSAEQMKRLQPQIKLLQEEHKADKQKFNEEFWKLCKANGVNPLGGCMPLVVQMPILIMIYGGIRAYIVPFDRASFLWVPNLSQPDTILLVAYAASMVLFQRMTNKTNPASMDPQQAQQQRMMTWMMPIMFLWLFKGLPAAFILYWLGTNLVYFAQQWWYSHQSAAALAAAGGAEAGVGASGGKPAGLLSGIVKSFSRPKAADDGASPSTATSYEERTRAAKGKKMRRSDADDQKKRGPRRRR
jgi:YidC/Oxa1 family membrane protein insertase